METTAVMTTPQITNPKGPQDFRQPVTISWDSMGTPDVTGWWLCVGTVEMRAEVDVNDGNWDVLSGDLRLGRNLTIDVSDRPNLKGIRVQLLCTVQDDELDTRERTMVLEPMVFKSI